MKIKTLIEELKQFPEDSHVHVLVADYAPKTWQKIITIMDETDPGGKRHAVISVFMGEHSTYEPNGKLQ